MSFSDFGRRVLVAAGAFAVLGAAPAQAADWALGLEGGYHAFSNAPDSTDAIFGSSGAPLLGVTGRVGLGRAFFVSATLRGLQKEGERVALGPNDEVFPLGHPVTLTVVPVYGMVGYRFRAGSSLVPYVGVGAGAAMIEEESEVAGETTTTSTTKFTGQAAAGLELGRGTFRVAGEVGYSLIPGALGEGGVSEHFGEDDLGGLSAVLRLVLAF